MLSQENVHVKARYNIHVLVCGRAAAYCFGVSMDLAKQIGGRIRQLRTQQGLTLEQLASAAGLPPESISRVERGRTVASLRSLSRLAHGLGVALAQLVEANPVSVAHVDPISAEVRGIALLLADEPPEVVEWVQEIVQILLRQPRKTLRSTSLLPLE
jgi:transcriptional regulator with XRE-family HTH domain